MESNLQGIDIAELAELRHQLHERAELSGEERETARTILEFLQPTGPDQIIEEVGGNGLMFIYKGNSGGPRVMIRCELDALPIPETIDLPYKSQTGEVSHKCGHDGHMAIVAGVGRWLQHNRPGSGEVVLLFQPSEETGQGARRVLEDSRFKELKPDYIYALHNLPGAEKHRVVVREGSFASASVGLSVRLEGGTSHAAHPEEGNNPAQAMSQIIQGISSIPQFYAPMDAGTKATVIYARLGEKALGTSPGKAEIMATLRTYDNDRLRDIQERAVAIATGIAETYNLGIHTHWLEPFSATVNDRSCVEVVRKAARRTALDVKEKEVPFGWSEDFGFFTEHIPGALFGLGSGIDQPQLHAGNYDFSDDLMSTGISVFINIIREHT